MGANTQSKMKLLEYGGILHLEELIDWIAKMEKYFDLENILENKKVKFVVTKLTGHATVWWNFVP